MSFLATQVLFGSQFGDFTYVEHTGYIEISDYPEDASGAVVIPATINSKPVTIIGTSAFKDCRSISSVIVPEGVTEIRESAFSVCWDMTQIQLPSTLKLIGADAFHFTELSHITVPEGVVSIGDRAFDFSTRLESISLPSTLNTIGEGAFQQTKLISVNIPEGVTMIGAEAFYFCNSLTNITLPSSLQSIGEGAFSHTRLTSISIPPQITSLEKDIFNYCTTLETITYEGSNITSIGQNAFRNTSLQVTPIPESVSSIGEGAFSNCDQLQTAHIPAYVLTIGSAPFESCQALTSITVDKFNTVYTDIDGVLFTADKSALLTFPSGKNETEYTVPDSTTLISRRAFSGNDHLESIVFPSSLIEIGSYAFLNSSMLSEVTISSSVTAIGDGAFSACNQLEAIDVAPSNPKFVQLEGVLYDQSVTTLYAYPAGKENTAYTFPLTTRTILPYAFAHAQSLETIQLPEKLESIGTGAFSNCSDLKDITLPQAIELIPALAFYRCISLETVKLPDSLIEIGHRAFSYCSSLSQMIMPIGLAIEAGTAFELSENLIAIYYLGNAPDILGYPSDRNRPRYFFSDAAGHTNYPWFTYNVQSMGDRTDTKIWLLNNELAYDTNMASETNDRGTPLLLPYAFNLTATEQPNLTPVINGELLEYTFFAARSELSYTVQTRTNLRQPWLNSGYQISEVDEDGYQKVTLDKRESNQRFLQIVVDFLN